MIGIHEAPRLSACMRKFVSSGVAAAQISCASRSLRELSYRALDPSTLTCGSNCLSSLRRIFLPASPIDGWDNDDADNQSLPGFADCNHAAADLPTGRLRGMCALGDVRNGVLPEFCAIRRLPLRRAQGESNRTDHVVLN